MGKVSVCPGFNPGRRRMYPCPAPREKSVLIPKAGFWRRAFFNSQRLCRLSVYGFFPHCRHPLNTGTAGTPPSVPAAPNVRRLHSPAADAGSVPEGVRPRAFCDGCRLSIGHELGVIHTISLLTYFSCEQAFNGEGNSSTPPHSALPLNAWGRGPSGGRPLFPR